MFQNFEWSLLVTLKTLLEPFYKATLQLQIQSYPMLSRSKIIEKSLFKYFLTKSDKNNSNRLERLLASHINEFLQKYLVEKISKQQKRIELVMI